MNYTDQVQFLQVVLATHHPLKPSDLQKYQLELWLQVILAPGWSKGKNSHIRRAKSATFAYHIARKGVFLPNITDPDQK